MTDTASHALCHQQTLHILDDGWGELLASNSGQTVQSKRHFKFIAAGKVNLDSLEDETSKLARLAQQHRHEEIALQHQDQVQT